MRELTLGSVDGAMGLYERCGCQGRLVLQLIPPARRDEIAQIFAGFALLETQWQGIPQVWVQTPAVDFTLTDRVRGWEGVHAQWVISRDLDPYRGCASIVKPDAW